MLSDEVKNKLNKEDVDLSNYTTKEELQEAIENVDVDLSNYTTKEELQEALTDDSLLTDDKSLVGAINELFQSANNGKEIIADAIGEPLNSEDTFAAMGNDINGLLSTFKTNMMNNGIAIESTDKFKSLIDKIASMAEDSSGKGIQFAEGSGSWKLESDSYSSQSVTITTNLNFTPTYVFVYGEYAQVSGSMMMMGNASLSIDNIIVSNLGAIGSSGDTTLGQLSISDITANSFTLKTSVAYYYKIYATKWYAIGVGEEDTTLRDSLASILEEEGVEVSEEDDMASLISKVNSELDRKNEEIANSGGLDIISATELPATGKENQICVITQNPVDKFVLSSNFNDVTSDNSQITLYLGNLVSTDTSLGTLVQSVSGSVTTNYYIYKVCQNTDRLASYIYQNSQWNALTVASVFSIENTVLRNSSVFGSLNSNVFATHASNLGYKFSIQNSDYPYVVSTYSNKINFSLFSKVKIKARYEIPSDSGTSATIKFSACTNSTVDAGEYADADITILGAVYNSGLYNIPPSMLTATTEFTIDISTWTGEYYPGVTVYVPYKSYYVYITDIEFI